MELVKRFLLITALFLISISRVSAQAPKETKMLPGEEMINAYVKKRTDEISKNFMAGAKSKAEWEKLRPKPGPLQ